jgi:hypothetical protein
VAFKFLAGPYFRCLPRHGPIGTSAATSSATTTTSTFPPRPARPAFVSRPMSSGILGFSFPGISMILFSLCNGIRYA